MEAKVCLSLFVPGAKMLSERECEENPKENYNEEKVVVTFTTGKGKHQKEHKKVVTIHTRKPRLITHNININKEAYDYMLSTPTTPKLAKPVKYNKSGDVVKRVWDTMSEDYRLKAHFSLIAQDMSAIHFSYEILDD